MIGSLCVALVITAAPAVPQKLAMPAFTLVHVDEQVGAVYGDHLAQAMESHGFQVITAKQIATILGFERQKELTGCNDSSCMAELANALGSDAILSGDVAKLEAGYQIELKVYSAANAKTLASYAAHVDKADEIIPSLDEGANELSATLRGESYQRPTVRRFAFIPAIAGAVFLVGGGAATMGASSAFHDLTPPRSTPLSDPDAVANRGKMFQTLSYVGYGLGAAGLITAAALYVAGAPETKPTVSVGVTPGGVTLMGVLP